MTGDRQIDDRQIDRQIDDKYKDTVEIKCLVVANYQ